MSKLLQILTGNNKILRQKSKEIKLDEIKEYSLLFDEMIYSMKESDGIGLAAPQIGKNIALIIVNTKHGPQVMINPKITKKSIFKEWDEEGCLSVPNTFGKVKRHKKITCEFVSKEGTGKKVEAKGLMARVIQHEMDHLNGILFTDIAKNIKVIKQK